jgi:transposase
MTQCKTIAVDLAKDVYEIGFANRAHRIVQRKRLNRAAFRKLLTTQPAAVAVMEACGTAHFWGRFAIQQGHQVKILPAQYVRPYRRRNKTDRADVSALVEANRCAEIRPVPVRSIDQQQIQQLHRMREQWKKTRTARINQLRGCLRELGVFIPVGAARAIKHATMVLDDDTLPAPLRQIYGHILDDICGVATNIKACEQQLAALTDDNNDVRTLNKITGIGPLTSTAMVAAAGSPHHFKSARHFASWLELTPRETSSGRRRFLGKISKQGGTYLRTLLIHGARSTLIHARRRHMAGQPLDQLQQWAVGLHDRLGHNKAAVALANKLARICWATWKHQRDYDGNFAPAFA